MGYKTYLKLFTSTFYISAFTFGGGFVIIPLLRKKFVDELGWLQEEEMMDLAAIAQSSPGPIAVNASILIGPQGSRTARRPVHHPGHGTAAADHYLYRIGLLPADS